MQDVESLQCSKKLKLSTPEDRNILNDFEFVKILNDNNQKKLIFVQAIKKVPEHQNGNNGTEAKEEPRDAILIFEKPHFGLDETKSLIDNESATKVDFVNDIYTKLSLYPDPLLNSIQVQLIFPATATHIAKYTAQDVFFLQESYQDYTEKTLPHITKAALGLGWVYNILDHKKEADRIVLEDTDPETGFILIPDMKWDGETKENLYLQAIVHKRDIKSLRDLTGVSHLALLENVKEKCLNVIEVKYGIKRNRIRSYLHYQPSFYHMHVHFTHIKNVSDMTPERNHSLNSVIENLKIASDFYQKTTLEFVIKKGDGLYSLYKDRFEPETD